VAGAILISKLVSNISIAIVDHVEIEISNLLDLLVHALLQDPVHATLGSGEHENWLGVIHQASKQVGTVCQIDQSCCHHRSPTSALPRRERLVHEMNERRLKKNEEVEVYKL
jgi:hypothetical protein